MISTAPAIVRRLRSRAFSMIEMIGVLAIMAILASAVLPMAELTVTRTKEIELRRALREVRSAIDAWKDDYDKAAEQKKIITSINETGYPESLEELLEGNDWGGLYPYKRRYLGSIPRHPFDRDARGWQLRAYEDDPDSTIWGGENVYDIHSQSDETGLDGTPYKEW